MDDLKAAFESMGFSEVVTYIQSGNVIFNSKESDLSKVTKLVEKTLSTKFAFNSTVVILTHEQLIETVKQAPREFGHYPIKYKYDVVFIKSPFSAAVAFQQVKTREGVDKIWQGECVLYFRKLIIDAEKSRLIQITNQPAYKFITIRNWNTTSQLLELMA
jgi:uncharacterized protein (DUF1697 family)